ncbi:hypothetical protein [Succinivibrio sp.]|uniref:hypothetical protein n=1 Tax=Succinivibrio sp. TaxID=2053619 RepID=UPI00386AE079
MKKTLLGIAIITSGLCANAATVYDKDGTSIDIGGRVQSVLYSTKNIDHLLLLKQEDSYC